MSGLRSGEALGQPSASPNLSTFLPPRNQVWPCDTLASGHGRHRLRSFLGAPSCCDKLMTETWKWWFLEGCLEAVPLLTQDECEQPSHHFIFCPFVTTTSSSLRNPGLLGEWILSCPHSPRKGPLRLRADDK